MTADAPVLEVADLTVTFGADRREALSHVSLTVRAGEVMALVGESGCGKSLTALAVMGLLPRGARVAGGRIEVAGAPVLGVRERALRRMRGRTMAMVFQDPMQALSPLQPVGRQIAEPLAIHTSLTRRQRRQRAYELLDAVGVPEPRSRARHLPHEFSGGLRQRVMIAMALACQPKLLIADEPTTALDVTIQAQILDLLRELTKARQTAVLFITHDMAVVAEMADQVTVMYAGHVVERASVTDLFAAPAHPYSAALLRSVPRLDTPPGQDLPTIPGRVPGPGEAPPGCPFQNRCPNATRRCEERPPLAPIRDGHLVACWQPALEPTP